jgi:Nitrous oxide-stimulated promoter
MTSIGHIQSAAAGPAAEGGQGAGRCLTDKRLGREWRTMAAMISCYCRDHHATKAALCPECQGLLDYAAARLERCRFGPEKPVCAKCPVHCYQPARREQVKAVMRYAGPRMLWQHPVLSLRHWLDGFRKAPALI